MNYPNIQAIRLAMQRTIHRLGRLSLVHLLTSTRVVKCGEQLKWAEKFSDGVFGVSQHTAHLRELQMFQVAHETEYQTSGFTRSHVYQF